MRARLAQPVVERSVVRRRRRYGLSDKLGHLGFRRHRLDHDDVPAVDAHVLRLMPLAPHDPAANFDSVSPFNN
jgi:hypothetical protein